MVACRESQFDGGLKPDRRVDILRTGKTRPGGPRTRIEFEIRSLRRVCGQHLTDGYCGLTPHRYRYDGLYRVEKVAIPFYLCLIKTILTHECRLT